MNNARLHQTGVTIPRLELKEVSLICNPRAGTANESEALASLLQAAGFAVQIVDMDAAGPENAAKLALERGARLVIAAGGDGTISSVAAAVAGTDSILGVIPSGTLNHFAKDLGIPLELEKAVQTIAAGRVVAVDVGEVNGRIFINNSSLGVYPLFARFQQRHRRTGRSRILAAFRACLSAFQGIRFVRFQLQVNGQLLERLTPMIFFGNNHYDPEAGTREDLHSGSLCVHIVNAKTRRQLIGLALRALFRKLRTAPEMESFSTKEAIVNSKRARLRVAADGEVYEMTPPLRYRIHPSALRVLVP